MNERKWKIIRIVGGIVLLLVGTIFGLISLYMNGWDIVRFLKNPTTDLILLCLLALGVMAFSWKKVE